MKSTEPVELVSRDIWGYMEEFSIGGSFYCVVFKNYYTKYRQVFFIKKQFFNVWKHHNECKMAGHIMKSFMSDGGTEFFNSKVK